ncbi:metallopeptidase [Dysosmobacter sp. Marseille-Q4140]|nr:metallopeptidase [Dysosmobacter sp. Marseille-Q4140]
MEDHVAAFRRADGLAREVLDLARSTLLVHLRFLDLALSRFTPVSYPGTLATDGQKLFYDVYYLLNAYRQEQNRPVRDYLHMVLHCVFHHLFTGPGIDRRCWDLACDIAVEAAIRDLDLPCAACRRDRAQEETLAALAEQVHPLTAEKLYRHFLDQNLRPDQTAQLRQPFLADDHRAWYLPVKGGSSAGGEGQEPPPEGGIPARDKQGRGGSSARRKQDPPSGTEERKELEKAWKEISRRIQVDLETASRRHGLDAGSLVQSLRPVTREHYDYADFLRRYMSLGEVVQVNNDEFDYIFYTYGLSLYGNMPLVEPLEYKEVRRIREFVVAIDTSGSVSGDLVQRFVTKTYNILRQQENFFTKINLHIIQCDAQIQEDAHITCQRDFEDYLAHMELHGFGGTDFRPVFQYVDQLIRDGAFTNLRGMIYFTDGAGIFPERKPDYDAAFVFVGDEGLDPDVPVWAIKLVLQSEEI